MLEEFVQPRHQRNIARGRQSWLARKNALGNLTQNKKMTDKTSRNENVEIIMMEPLSHSRKNFFLNNALRFERVEFPRASR